jgi:hypothetical protein
LVFGRCQSLTELPESIAKLTQLTYLGLWECKSLTKLPESISNLTQLTDFDLRGCDSLDQSYWYGVFFGDPFEKFTS